MKNSKYSHLIYIAATICFLLVVVSIVSDSPELSPPAAYVYLEEDVSSQAESSQIEEGTSSEVISSEGESGTSSTAAKPPDKPPSKPPIKQYVSSIPAVFEQTSSVISSKEAQKPRPEQPSKPEKEDSSEESSKSSSKEEKPTPDTTSMVNLNTASKEQLMTLDGIGEVISDRIIAFREQIGGFLAIEEFTNVEGIGPKTFEKNKHRLTVE